MEQTNDVTGAKLASPWAIYARKCMKLFELDDEVEVKYDNDAPSLTLLVSNAVKADALAQIMPVEMQFGNVTLDIAVVPANDTCTVEQIWRLAFEGNPVLVGTDVEKAPDGSPVIFALFAPECVQYLADDIGNPFGIQTRTYEQVAHDVLNTEDVIVTSDLME